MKTYTVNQLARLAGLSVRALHHYDEIGLLKPAFTGDNNRYRYYGEDELLRLQQILIHRELDIPLSEIGAILDAPGFDRLETLQKQRERLEEQAKRYARMVRTIDRTIAHLKGERRMQETDRAKRKTMAEMTEAERTAAMAERKEVEEGRAPPPLGRRHLGPGMRARGLCRPRRHLPAPRLPRPLRGDRDWLCRLSHRRHEGVGPALRTVEPLAALNVRQAPISLI